MSLSSVRPFFRTRLDGLGFIEWDDGFQFDNVPETILNKAYHLQIGTIGGGPANQTTHVFEYPITLRVHFKGFRDVNSAIDDVVSESETILEDILAPSVRLGTAIKDVVCDSVNILPLDASNDNNIVLQMEFTSTINCNF